MTRRKNGLLVGRQLEPVSLQERIAERKANSGPGSPHGTRSGQWSANDLRPAFAGSRSTADSTPMLPNLATKGRSSTPSGFGRVQSLPRLGSSGGLGSSGKSASSTSPSGTRRDSPKAETSQTALADAMNRAEVAGVTNVQIVRAELVLQKDRESEGLLKAVVRGDLKEIRAAIARAEKVGVAKDLVEGAKAHLKQHEALEAMGRALEAEDAPALSAAISQARLCKCEKEDIKAATQMLERIEARGRLRAAIEVKKEDVLTYAIDEAEIVGLQCLDDPVLKEAKALKKQLRGK